jgi:steroid delta-isomerase-like uncharacterized protein
MHSGEGHVTHDEVLDLCRRWQDAFDARDLKALAPLYAEAATLESPMAGTVTGRDAVVGASKGLFGLFPDVTVTSEVPLVDGDRVAIVAELAGTQIGSFMGLPETNKRFRFTLVFLLDVKDGQIARDRRIYDFTGVLVQLGVLKAKPL